jgi:hypothetical protein
VSAIFVALLLGSTAILSVILGVFGAYCAINGILAAFNPSKPALFLRALIPTENQVSGD